MSSAHIPEHWDQFFHIRPVISLCPREQSSAKAGLLVNNFHNLENVITSERLAFFFLITAHSRDMLVP